MIFNTVRKMRTGQIPLIPFHINMLPEMYGIHYSLEIIYTAGDRNARKNHFAGLILLCFSGAFDMQCI